MINANDWLFMIGPGWHLILSEAIDQLNEVAAKHNVEVRVGDVKEKFGTLRVYVDGGYSEEVWNDITPILDELERASKVTNQW